MKNRSLWLIALAFAAPLLTWAQTPLLPVLKIDLSEPLAKVSPTLHGLMTEEINYSYDGGLYAELIRNRVFRNDPKGPVNWTLIKAAGAEAEMALTEKKPLTDKLPISLELSIKTATPQNPVAVANEGYWGIPVRPQTTYHLSFYVKGSVEEIDKKTQIKSIGFNGPLTVRLENNEGSKVFAQSQTPIVNGHWQRVELDLKTGAEVVTSSTNRLVISAQNPGTIWLSLVSLFPPTYHDRPNGNRIDLMEKLAAMRPKFLRFPGGNFLEGDTLMERFDWKQTVGPLPFRPGHRSCWNYQTTDGLGLLEFMGWCEDLHMEPVLAVYAGYSMKQQPVEPGPLLDYYVQDALDEIEYLSGDAKTSMWAALRAKNGHPEPFHLKYIEIGNEDYFDHSKSYDARFTQFYDAFKAKYPALELIATAPVQSRKPDLIDDHYYRSAKGFFDDIHHYDKSDRNGPKIFVGEWATREGEPTPNFNAALGDAAWMTGMERNSDLIVMHAYAPLLVNTNPGGMQWKTDLIGYDTLNCYGSPSYYAQVMFSNNIGDQIAKTTLAADPGLLLPYSVTRESQSGKIYIKVVNPGATPVMLQIELPSVKRLLPEGKATILHADSTTETNTMAEPTKIMPKTEAIKGVSTRFSRVFEPYSITVLELQE